jgi:hypothetical protein
MIHKVIENLKDIALKLSGESRTLSQGSESLNIALANILTLSVDYSGVNRRDAPRYAAYGTNPYRDVLTTDSKPRFSSSADSDNPRLTFKNRVSYI